MGRLLTRDEAVRFVGQARALGRRIVFTNGVFDILHPGHVRYLAEARAQGDVLVVGVNSDASVRRLQKGPDRPLHPEQERAEVLQALRMVDAVVIFGEETPHEIVSAIQPDVLVKGSDWAADEIIGRDIVEARGGKVVRIPLAPGYSTSSIIARLRSS